MYSTLRILNTLEQQSQNIPIIQDSIVENEDNYIIESNETKELLDELCNKPKWHLWFIHSNFNSLEKMNKDIIALENCRTMPRT
ncbi:hypothetical protein C1645_825055 [Glomus cerebriforme]|uniref:Uncharacterized protein n=1 Tax=Glomus cerebriforme TaxID=658196 RepID=A0A397SSZ7_9GLOM|nr:hypothetical protein C1645_825055 [Glomus cerebriforme]